MEKVHFDRCGENILFNMVVLKSITTTTQQQNELIYKLILNWMKRNKNQYLK